MGAGSVVGNGGGPGALAAAPAVSTGLAAQLALYGQCDRVWLPALEVEHPYCQMRDQVLWLCGAFWAASLF